MKQKSDQFKIRRYLSLDVFRGMTVTLMIIVNSPGNPMPYDKLQHAVSEGCRLADVVFPFFIILVGISSVLAISSLKSKGMLAYQIFKKILKRSVSIFLLGLLLNMVPYHLLDYSHLRIMGVLQRIALCYFASASLCLITRMRTQALIMCILLIIYAFTPWIFSGDLIGYIDRLILSPEHLYQATGTFDPEGILSTLPAIASALFGNLIGFLLIANQTKQQQLKKMLGISIVLLTIGWGLSDILPMNKSLWSSSYAIWTAGLFLFSFTLVYALIEIKQWSTWSSFFNLFGRHALLVYMLHVLFFKIQLLIKVHDATGALMSLRSYITQIAFGFLNPSNASFAYSLSYVMLWFGVLYIFDKIKK